MENIQIENFMIKVKDLIEEKDDDGKFTLYITDSEIKKDEFDFFRKFYKTHSNSKDDYFKANINKKDFYGRFGQLIYSEQDDFYNVRLTFVESTADEQESTGLNYVLDDAEYGNLLKKVVNQEVIIERLVNILKESGTLTEKESTDLLFVNNDDSFNNRLELYAKVDDLDKYLQDQKSTLTHLTQ